MVQLRGKETGAPRGIISRNDLKFLVDKFGEESIGDIKWSRIQPVSKCKASTLRHEGEKRT